MMLSPPRCTTRQPVRPSARSLGSDAETNSVGAYDVDLGGALARLFDPRLSILISQVAGIGAFLVHPLASTQIALDATLLKWGRRGERQRRGNGWVVLGKRRPGKIPPLKNYSPLTSGWIAAMVCNGGKMDRLTKW
jgi:hypothetical protein